MNYNLTAEQGMIVRSLPAFREQELEPHEADVGRVIDSIRALVDFAASHHHKLLELDINPMMVTPHRCVIVDVLIREAV